MQQKVTEGLTSQEVQETLLKWGPNEVPERSVRPWVTFAWKFWGLSACGLAMPALAYDSNTVNVQPLGEITVTYATLPSSIQLSVSWNGGAYGTATTFQTTGHAAGDTYLLAGQYAPGSTLTSGLYPWLFKVTANSTNLYFGSDYPVVANDSSAFGAGWSLSGLDQLYVAADGNIMWSFGANASPAVKSAVASLGASMPYRHPVGVTISILWWGIYVGCFGMCLGAALGAFVERVRARLSERSDQSDYPQPTRGTVSPDRKTGPVSGAQSITKQHVSSTLTHSR